MASIEIVIRDLEEMPQKIGQRGEELVKASIQSHGHVDTGTMLGRVHSEVYGSGARIWVWSRYASLVNEGHAGAVPKHTTKNGQPGWLKLKSSPKWPGGFARRTRGYAGSHFFDEAAEQLKAYIRTL